MPLHGDLVNALTCAVFLPFYVHMAASESTHHGWGPTVVCLTFATIATSGHGAWWYSDTTASWVSFVATMGSILGIGLYQWPHDDELLLRIQYVWQLLICTANTSHTLFTKVLMGGLAACTAISLSHLSPLYTVQGNCWVILGFLGLFVALNFALSHWLGRSDATGSLHAPATATEPPWELTLESGAKFILVSCFLCSMGQEVYIMMNQSGYAVSGGYNIVRSGFFGAVGLIAASVWQERRRDSIPASLKLARWALDGTDTATACTHDSRVVTWCNAAFAHRVGQTMANVVNQTLDSALQLGKDDAKRLGLLFRSMVQSKLDVVAHGKMMRISVFPLSEANSSSGFVIVLNEITEDRD